MSDWNVSYTKRQQSCLRSLTSFLNEDDEILRILYLMNVLKRRPLLRTEDVLTLRCDLVDRLLCEDVSVEVRGHVVMHAKLPCGWMCVDTRPVRSFGRVRNGQVGHVPVIPRSMRRLVLGGGWDRSGSRERCSLDFALFGVLQRKVG